MLYKIGIIPNHVRQNHVIPNHVIPNHVIPNHVIQNRVVPLQNPTKFAQIGIFGLKTNHLATLVQSRLNKFDAASILVHIVHHLYNK
jgi:hypothetical protein